MTTIKISPSLENYLETIYFLQKNSESVRVTDLAKKMDISKAGVNKAIKNLKELDLVNHSHYGSISLNEKGEQLALEIAKRHAILFKFFHDVLGVPKEEAENEACSVEHLVSSNTIEKLNKHINSL